MVSDSVPCVEPSRGGVQVPKVNRVEESRPRSFFPLSSSPHVLAKTAARPPPPPSSTTTHAQPTHHHSLFSTRSFVSLFTTTFILHFWTFSLSQSIPTESRNLLLHAANLAEIQSLFRTCKQLLSRHSLPAIPWQSLRSVFLASCQFSA